MDAFEKLARKFKERDNPAPYSPVFGTIISLPDLKIRINSKIILDGDDVKNMFNIYETTEDGEYMHINKTAVLLPYKDNQKYVAIGVLE